MTVEVAAEVVREAGSGGFTCAGSLASSGDVKGSTSDDLRELGSGVVIGSCSVVSTSTGYKFKNNIMQEDPLLCQHIY